MSPGEALMWNVEKDPWLNPSAASVSIVDGPIDIELITLWLAGMVADVPRLRERVRHGVARFTPPSWVPDAEFDFRYHVRHVGLAAPGSERQLLDLVGLLFRDPYDRTRPPWQVIVIDGLEGDRSAVMMKLHHTIADGYGMARLQERFMVRDPNTPPPPPVDLDAVVAETCALAQAANAEQAEGPAERVVKLITAPVSATRWVTGEVAQVATGGPKSSTVVSGATGLARMALSQVRSSGGGESGSPLWRGRSSRRHIEVLPVSLPAARETAKTLGGSLNDLFLTALTAGAVTYHEKRGVQATAFNTSFVVNTRSDAAEGGNSFAPLRVKVPATPMSNVERFAAIQSRIAEQRAVLSGGGLMGSFARVINLLPTSVTTRAARAQAARLDFATSNVRGASRPLFIAGLPMTSLFAPGPVAASAMIVTLISYLDTAYIAFTIDPAAVEEPAELRQSVADAFEDLVAS
jgi:WS/DGAT/MGAT family acyltransferase